MPDQNERARPAAALASVRAKVTEAVRFHPREAFGLAVLAVLLVVGAAISYARGRPVDATPLAPLSSAPVASASPSPQIWVDVSGAVRKPGVYKFDQGARVFDAVRAAGGLTRGADEAAINLARPLVDGEQIIVPKKGESVAPAGGTGGGSASSNPGGKVNLNIATESDFEGLPGIGPVLAQRIVDYRTQHGPFRSVQDLMKVPGIGPKKFDSLQSYVTV